MDDKFYLAVWKDCKECCGDGRDRMPYGDKLAVLSGLSCRLCIGLGKKPTFIPLKELTVSSFRMSEFGGYSKSESLDLQEAVEAWMEKKEKEIDKES